LHFAINDYQKYASQIRDAEIAEQLPRDLLAVALCQASEFQPEKVFGKNLNPVGVIGIGKITRHDCAWLWGGRDLRSDPAAAIRGAARILRRHFSNLHCWRDSLVAYHSGIEFVTRHKRGLARLPIDARRYVGEAINLVLI